LGDDGPSYSAVKNWVAEFKRGRSSVVDRPKHRSGLPKDATHAENIQINNDMLNKDRRLTIRHIVETTSTVHRIVSEDLGMRKVSARWVPRMLTEEQKKVYVNVCNDLLSRLQAEPQTFLDRIVTQDETWVHHIDPDTKRQSMIWKHVTSPSPKEIQGYPISRQGYGDGLLEQSRSYNDKLSVKRFHGHRCILCQ